MKGKRMLVVGTMLATVGLSLAGLMTGKAFAEPSATEQTGQAAAGGGAAVLKVGNKVCPVMGGPVDLNTAVKVIHNGKEYNLCCAGCLKAFQEDPEKYSLIAEESMAGTEQQKAKVGEVMNIEGMKMEGMPMDGMKDAGNMNKEGVKPDEKNVEGMKTDGMKAEGQQ